MIAEAQLGNGIAVALNNSPKQIAFVRQARTALIDDREGVRAIWDNKGVSINEVDYAFNQWHNLEEDSDLFKYWKSLITSDYQEPIVMHFG